MRHGSLFSGIGGFDLAAQWMGWENVFHCEWEEFPRKVLQYYWPKAKSYGDIKETDFNVWRGQIGVLSGGFPCQPFSAAGRRRGTSDDRYLWPEYLRAIREIKPSWIVGENVAGLISMEDGKVLEGILTDLENEGYTPEVFLIPACGVEAIHRRDRIWIAAYTRHPKPQRGGFEANNKGRNEEGEQKGDKFTSRFKDGPNTNSDQQRQQRQRGAEQPSDKTEAGDREKCGTIYDGGWPTEPPVCGPNDALSQRLDGITISKHRKESLKAYGNAIVPTVAYEIFKAIDENNL